MVGKYHEDFLFPSIKTDRKIITTHAYRILVAAEEWISGHDTMLKTFGYYYYKSTKDVYTLMKTFGYASPSITKYNGIREDEIIDSLKDFQL
ncbi:integrase [Bacillus spongiae]|uniref:Integrase n=1 Tax=Bacillus spongiae TaxID=2683610 RepID=A0ABU8HK58_9BACI